MEILPEINSWINAKKAKKISKKKVLVRIVGILFVFVFRLPFIVIGFLWQFVVTSFVIGRIFNGMVFDNDWSELE